MICYNFYDNNWLGDTINWLDVKEKQEASRLRYNPKENCVVKFIKS